MRHGKLNKRFGRNKSARKELMRSLARNAIIYSRIKTTLPKAKEASRLLDRLISLGKTQTLQSRRAAFDILQDRSLVSRLEKDLAPLFKKRNGGYTRIIRLNNRHGDGAQMAILELVEKIKEEPKPKKKAKAAKSKEAVKPAEEKLEKPKTPEKEEKPETKKAEAAKKEPKVKEKKKPIPKKEEIKPKEKPPQAEKEKPKPKKEGWLQRVKGIFRREKP